MLHGVAKKKRYLFQFCAKKIVYLINGAFKFDHPTRRKQRSLPYAIYQKKKIQMNVHFSAPSIADGSMTHYYLFLQSNLQESNKIKSLQYQFRMVWAASDRKYD